MDRQGIKPTLNFSCGLFVLAAGYVILRGWCERSDNCSNIGPLPITLESDLCPIAKSKQQGGPFMKKTGKKENKVKLWFEVDDTGCGMNPMIFLRVELSSLTIYEFFSYNQY